MTNLWILDWSTDRLILLGHNQVAEQVERAMYRHARDVYLDYRKKEDPMCEKAKEAMEKRQTRMGAALFERNMHDQSSTYGDPR